MIETVNAAKVLYICTRIGPESKKCILVQKTDIGRLVCKMQHWTWFRCKVPSSYAAQMLTLSTDKQGPSTGQQGPVTSVTNHEESATAVAGKQDANFLAKLDVINTVGCLKEYIAAECWVGFVRHLCNDKRHVDIAGALQGTTLRVVAGKGFVVRDLAKQCNVGLSDHMTRWLKYKHATYKSRTDDFVHVSLHVKI